MCSFFSSGVEICARIHRPWVERECTKSMHFSHDFPEQSRSCQKALFNKNKLCLSLKGTFIEKLIYYGGILGAEKRQKFKQAYILKTYERCLQLVNIRGRSTQKAN